MLWNMEVWSLAVLLPRPHLLVHYPAHSTHFCTASYMSNSTRSILLFIFHVQHNTSMASCLSIVPQRIPSWQTTHSPKCILSMYTYILFLFCHVCHIFHNKHRCSLYYLCSSHPFFSSSTEREKIRVPCHIS